MMAWADHEEGLAGQGDSGAGGDPMSSEEHLLEIIRRKVLAGDLPRQPCRMTWYGPGKGAICVACNRPITSEDVEVECDLAGGGTLRFHRRCHDVWSAVWPRCDART
jgi:hypothetical protein